MSIKIPENELRFNLAGEIRSASEGEKLKFSGYAARFDSLSENLGGFREKIRIGAFSNAVKTDDVRCLFNHNSNYVLGRTSAKTLELREDTQGLWFEVEAPNTQWARDLHESVKRGDINQCSFAFVTKKDDWKDEGDTVVRELIEVGLRDVSIVTNPAYLQTSVQARSNDEIFEEYRKSKEPKVDYKFNLEKMKLELKGREI